MKQAIILLSLFITTIGSQSVHAQTKMTVSYDGLYIAKTGSVPAANIEIFTYLRFYADGTVCLQAVSANDPEAVNKWFGRDKKFSQKGTYTIDGSNIFIKVDNKESGEAKLEGPVTTEFKGVIKKGNQLCMFRDKETTEFCFGFTKM